MCDICRLYQKDWRFLSGMSSALEPARLYTFYDEHRARLNLCRFHSRELFLLGERRFLMEYVKLAQEMVVNKNQYAELS